MQKKKILSLVLSIAMIISVVAPLHITISAAESDVVPAEHNSEGVHLEKSFDPETGYLTLETYAQGEIVSIEVEENVPANIVLVVDQSGSMTESFGNTTRQAALKAAVNQFIDSTYNNGTENNIKHSLSVVKFSSSRNAGTVLEWTDIDSNGRTKAKNAIKNLSNPDGGTYIQYGVSLANNLFSGLTTAQKTFTKDGVKYDRPAILVVFTDGYPGSGTESVFDEESMNSANESLEIVSGMKADGVTVFTIGIHENCDPEADFNFATREQSGCVLVNDTDVDGIKGLNAFMHFLSSDYDETCTSMTSSPRNITFDADDSYYLSASDPNGLNRCFQTVSEIVNTAHIYTTLTEKAKIYDYISEYFYIDPEYKLAHTTKPIRVYTVDYDSSKGEFDDSTKTDVAADLLTVYDKDSEGFDPDKDKEYVVVTGFDFASHWCGPGATNGKKVVLEIPILKKEDLGYGQTEYPTNAPESGIYDEEGRLVDPYDQPVIDYYSVKYDFADDITDDEIHYNLVTGDEIPACSVENPTWEGHVFKGWKLYSGTPSVVGDKSYILETDIVYVAQWEDALTYNIEYYFQNIEDDEYTHVTEFDDVKTATQGEKVSVPDLDAEDIVGFEVSSSDKDVEITEDGQTIKQYLNRVVYKVTFKDTAETDPFKDEVRENVKHGSDIPDFEPTRKGYDFDGWAVGSADGDPAGEDYTITDHVELYALWKVKQYDYTVEYYFENTETGKFDINDNLTDSKKDDYDKTVEAPELDADKHVNYTLDKTVEGTVASGKVNEEGTLVLKLYYVRDRFTIIHSDGSTEDIPVPDDPVDLSDYAKDKTLYKGNDNDIGDGGEYAPSKGDQVTLKEISAVTYNQASAVAVWRPGKLVDSKKTFRLTDIYFFGVFDSFEDYNELGMVVYYSADGTFDLEKDAPVASVTFDKLVDSYSVSNQSGTDTVYTAAQDTLWGVYSLSNSTAMTTENLPDGDSFSYFNAGVYRVITYWVTKDGVRVENGYTDFTITDGAKWMSLDFVPSYELPEGDPKRLDSAEIGG